MVEYNIYATLSVTIKDILPRGQAYKRLLGCIDMSREMLHGLIDMIPEADTETIYNVLLKFIPSDVPDNDELKAIAYANESIKSEGTVSMDSIDW